MNMFKDQVSKCFPPSVRMSLVHLLLSVWKRLEPNDGKMEMARTCGLSPKEEY